MKQFRQIAVAALCMALVLSVGCSKTEDDSPESRVFGSPPVIENIRPTVDPSQMAVCDFTDFFTAGGQQFCRDILPCVLNEDRTACETIGDGIIDDTPIYDDGGVRIVSTYTEVRLDVTVSDPDSIAGSQSDVLFVGASFLTGEEPNQEEETLVLFDDGSTNVFQFTQKTSKLADCTPVPGDLDSCLCSKASYDVTSNDATQDDSVFSRAFAFVSPEGLPANALGLFQDCIAKGNAVATALVAGLSETSRELLIEAVDRSGNLTESPERVLVDIGFSDIECRGDPCACCILLLPPDPSADAPVGCFGLPGLRFVPNNEFTSFGSICPDGLCQSEECLSGFRG